MMHDLLGRLSQFGGEGALCVLFLLSIVNLGVIGQRVWFFARRHIDSDKFLKDLLPLLRARDVPRAEALSQRSGASLCLITLAGLREAQKNLPAVQQAFQTATAGERIQLEHQLVLLHELARLALLLGILGSLFDVLALSRPGQTVPPSDLAVFSLRHSTMIAAISPTIGGLLVAIPAWLARSMLNVRVQRIVGECEFVARVVSSQLSLAEPALAEPATPISSNQPYQVRRVAA